MCEEPHARFPAHALNLQCAPLLIKRVAGKLKSTSEWIREYVRSHPDYKFDSVVSDKINYDLCKIYAYVGGGYDVIPELTGKRVWVGVWVGVDVCVRVCVCV